MDQKFHFPTGLRRGEGGGGPDPFVVKDYEKGPFIFLKPSLKTKMNKNKEITSNLTYKLLKLDKFFILILNLENRVVRQIVFGEPLNCTS